MKFSCIVRKIEQRLSELIIAHSVIMGVFAGLVVLAVLWGKWLEVMCYLGCISAALIAFVQWASDRRVKRAELLNTLIEKLSHIDVGLLENSQDGSDDAALDSIALLSYIAYLYECSVISEAEFGALRHDFQSLLGNHTIKKLITEACKDCRNGHRRLPYEYLVKFGARYDDNSQFYTKLKRAWDMNVEFPQSDEVRCVIVGGDGASTTGEISEKEYATHLDVLNGIFNMGYRAHMRGSAKLQDGKEVWFPKYHGNKNGVEPEMDRWVNEISDQKCTIKEYWPSKGDVPEDRKKSSIRYVFAKDLDEARPVYRFLGVFGNPERHEHCFVYQRLPVKVNFA